MTKDEQKGLARALVMVGLFPLVALGGVYLISQPITLNAWLVDVGWTCLAIPVLITVTALGMLLRN